MSSFLNIFDPNISLILATFFSLSTLHFTSMFYFSQHPLGARHPDTKKGTWDGAYIAIPTSYFNVAYAFFDNGNEYIGESSNMIFPLLQRFFLYTQGWESMTPQDIIHTSDFDKNNF